MVFNVVVCVVDGVKCINKILISTSGTLRCILTHLFELMHSFLFLLQVCLFLKFQQHLQFTLNNLVSISVLFSQLWLYSPGCKNI